jgi:acyl transferase domain-containing protein
MSDDAIAVVGLACRVPGAEDVRQLWRDVVAGVTSVRRLSAEEVAAAGGPVDDPSWVPAFGVLADLEGFDADAFGYPAREAALLDPQHRMFLEVAWWALEDAGCDPARSESQIGVFAGCAANRYARHHLLGNPAVLPAGGLAEDWDDLLVGDTCDYLPARVAYALGLTGPTVAVQTACSSSLVAVCQAAQSLLDFRCDVAVAGGAAVVSTRQAGYRHRAGGTLAEDGVCRPFDAAATGQVFGNGAGAVVLKRLADALADGDPVHAVLPGWAVNNDGAARAGLLVPGVSGQAAVVAEALAAVGWDPAEVGYVEAHGSGTPVGDAIEVDALRRAFADSGPRTGPCVLGSVKANLGNLDAAAGVVSLVKTVLAVRDGVLPPTPHFTHAHPEVDFAAVPFEVLTAAKDWPGPRRAGVSSFGLGGTNAHVLVEQADQSRRDIDSPEWTVLVLSAVDGQALAELARRVAAHLRDGAGTVHDTAHTLAAGRRALQHRAAVTCRHTDDAITGLTELAAGRPPALDGPAPLQEAARTWLAGGPAPRVPGRRISVPGYPFRRVRHWVEPHRPGLTPRSASG